jgi:hypothetical protein
MLSLRFTFTPRKSNSLLYGDLVLLDGDRIVNQFIATSSLPGRQWWGSWELKGGLIPPRNDYTVATAPLWMPDIRGVEGSFYQISPFEVPTNGSLRGDFGVHFDANQPGSLGCVVLKNQKGWDAFRREMEPIAKLIKSIPLSVDYNK